MQMPYQHRQRERYSPRLRRQKWFTAPRELRHTEQARRASTAPELARFRGSPEACHTPGMYGSLNASLRTQLLDMQLVRCPSSLYSF
jgi:hypothetical protein